jgi:hypothetical protein
MKSVVNVILRLGNKEPFSTEQLREACEKEGLDLGEVIKEMGEENCGLIFSDYAWYWSTRGDLWRDDLAGLARSGNGGE